MPGKVPERRSGSRHSKKELPERCFDSFRRKNTTGYITQVPAGSREVIVTFNFINELTV
jgi:hypothetical protein